MKTIVITGSTAGIGLGLAKAFLQMDCRVVISSRHDKSIESVVSDLATTFSRDRIFGCACDITSYEQTQHLWDASLERFGTIDIWINNAGTINPQTPFVAQTPDAMRSVVLTNLLGAMYGCKVAMDGMIRQGFGQIYNMEGYGHDGSSRMGMSLYGSTKYALRYLTRSLVQESQNQPIQIGTLGPGIVVTDLLVDSYKKGDAANRKWARVVFNVMADHADVVCPWLAKEVLRNKATGRRIAWLTLPRMLSHIVKAPFRNKIWPD